MRMTRSPVGDTEAYRAGDCLTFGILWTEGTFRYSM